MCSKFSEGISCPETWLRLVEDLLAFPSLPYLFVWGAVPAEAFMFRSLFLCLFHLNPLKASRSRFCSSSPQGRLMLLEGETTSRGDGQDRAVDGLIHCCPSTSSEKSTPAENVSPFRVCPASHSAWKESGITRDINRASPYKQKKRLRS